MNDEKLKLNFFAAGVKFQKDWKDNLSKLEEGEVLQLVPEPDNRFDPNAIKLVSFKDIMLGYVPAKSGEAQVVANAMRLGSRLKATITGLQPDFEPWTALEVSIEEVDENPSLIMHGRTRETKNEDDQGIV